MAFNFSTSANFGWYNLDLDKLVILLLPMEWRKVRTVNFIQSCIAPLKELHYQFRTNRLRNLYRIQHNWMKCYMQDALNDEFDPQERRITIDEPDNFLNKYIYTSAENKPKYLGTMYLQTSAEHNGTGVDFTVNMHGVSGNIYDIRALVDFYRIAGPRYEIINLSTFSQEQNP